MHINSNLDLYFNKLKIQTMYIHDIHTDLTFLISASICYCLVMIKK